MRATWPGARSGRISITTLPLVVSRVSVFSASAMVLYLLLFPGIEKSKDHRPARDRIAEAFRKRKRRAAGYRVGQRLVIDRALLGRYGAALVGDAAAKDVAVTFKTQQHGEFHARADVLQARPLPAGAEGVANIVERVQRPLWRRRSFLRARGQGEAGQRGCEQQETHDAGPPCGAKAVTSRSSPS